MSTLKQNCEAHVKKACKGLRHVCAQNIKMVPLKEMSNVLSAEHIKPCVTIGDWVRLKRSKYKGKLAKVVDVDTVKHNVIVKLTPKRGAVSLSDKMDGADYLYKKVAFSSVATGDIHPSIEEVQSFREIGEVDADLATLFKGKEKKGCWMRGDPVMVVKGELKKLKGTIEHVEGDIVHIRPYEKIPLKTVVVRTAEIAKHFEPGCHVKVVCGRHEGATGIVVKSVQNELIILSDVSQDQIVVLAEQVIESDEISGSSSNVGIGYSGEATNQNSSTTKHAAVQVPTSFSKLLPGNPPSTWRRGTRHTVKRHDLTIGRKVKIIQGPYRGCRGCVKGTNGQYVRVELEAQMKVITVGRSDVSDYLVVSSTNCNMPQYTTGGETPLHSSCTPMQFMDCETP